MGTITSRLAWSKPSFVGSNFAGISLGKSLYVAGVLALSCAEAVPASAASARTNAREQVPVTSRSLPGLIDVPLRALMEILPAGSRTSRLGITGRASRRPAARYGGPRGYLLDL